jgi:hypothetical protein
VENLLGDFEYEVQAPYLLYRNQSQEVNGIWFYNPRECEDVANLFTRYIIFNFTRKNYLGRFFFMFNLRFKYYEFLDKL